MIRAELLRAFRMVEQKESLGRSMNVRKHIGAIVDNLTARRQLSRKSREADVDADTVRRWAKEGISSLSEQLESFVKACGYEPESVFEAKLKPLSSRSFEAPKETSRASRIASKLVDATQSQKLSDEDLHAIELMIDRLARP